MKKITALLFVIVLSVSMTACGSGGDTESLSKQDVEVTGVEFDIPQGYTKQQSDDGMDIWYGPDYPSDLSNIVAFSGDKDSRFTEHTEAELKEQWSAQIKNQYSDQGMEVTDMNIDVCEYTTVSGFDAVKIHMTYTLSGTDIEQLEYVIDADKTHVYTFTTAPGSDSMDAFIKAADSLRVNYK